MLATIIFIMNISTKTGDQGDSSLANGERLEKSAPYFEAIGNIDELNSWLGVVAAHLEPQFSAQRESILVIQKKLFTLSAELALAKNIQLDDALLSLLEKESLNFQKQMSGNWQNQFLLPGGMPSAAWLDVARTVCRRAERSVVRLAKQTKIRPIILQTLNRLSDYLYVARCWVNFTLNYTEKISKK